MPSPANGSSSPRPSLRVRSWRKHTSTISDYLSHRRHSGQVPTLSSLQDTSTRGYDGEFRDDLAGPAGNGVRVWYENFSTIDWIHDMIKESIRIRRIRYIPGIRGWLANFWDRSQGWIIVTITGLLTACAAGIIVAAEMWLFDIKDGHCLVDWRMSKRRCCPQFIDSIPKRGGFITAWAPLPPSTKQLECPEWQSWSQTFSIYKSHSVFNAFVYIALSLLFATIASLMTVYLSSSESVYSTKDETAPSPVRSPPAPLRLSPSTAGLAKQSTLRSSYGTIPKINSSTNLTSPNIPRTFSEPTSFVADPPPQIKKRKVMYFAAGAGVAEIKTILSGFVIRGYLGTWTLFTKIIGLFLSVASGLTLGKEGPFVHISSCIGNITSRFFPKFDTNEAKRREILSASCASGVAVAFGAPIGGVLFSLEEVSYFFPPKVMWRSFFCAMIAAVTLKYIDPFGKGKIVLFEVTYDRETTFLELFGFLVLGLFGGVYGAYFSKWNFWWSRRVRSKTFLNRWPVLEVVLVTALTVSLSLSNRMLKTGGTELVYEMFAECKNNPDGLGLCIDSPDKVWPLVLTIGYALVIKGLLTIITFGIKVPAGIFIPTLGVGACFGRIAGLLIEYAYSKHHDAAIFKGCHSDVGFGQACVLPGIWAMVGAAATLAGVTRTTVSLAVIMFELTGTLTYVVPVMLAVLVAKTTADAIEHRGIYDLVIELLELPFLDAKREYVHVATPGEIVDADAPVIVLEDINTVETLKDKVQTLQTTSYAHGFPILSRGENGELWLHAYIAARDLLGRLVEVENNINVSLDTRCTFTPDGRRDNISSTIIDISAPALSPGGGSTSVIEFAHLTDNAPVTVNINSPMELLHEIFVKLGVRYLVVIDEKGIYYGVIEKNRWLGYLDWTQKKAKYYVRAENNNNNNISSYE